jgi:anthranilate phosphoribosyltransferase
VHETRAGGEVRSYTIEPEQFGLRRAGPDEVRGGTVEANVALARRVLDGQPGPPRDAVLLNAGACLYVAGRAASIAEGMHQAAAELDSGRAQAKIEQVAQASQRLKAELAATGVA